MSEKSNDINIKELFIILICMGITICFFAGMIMFVDWWRYGTHCQQYLSNATKFNSKGELTEANKLYLTKYCDWKF